jgi:hypothetical protein
LTLPYGGGSTLVPNMEIANDRQLKIGDLARQTGLSIKTIRYYERRGLLEKRGVEVTPFRVGKLAEDAGLDGWKVINRMASADAEYAGGLAGLADKLDLTEPEMMELAHAFTFERREDELADLGK